MSLEASLLLAIVSTLFSVVLFRVRYGSFDPFAPGTLLTFTLAVAYLGPYIPFDAGVDGFSEYWSFHFTDRGGSVGSALLLYCLMLFGIQAGCALAGPTGAPRRRIERPIRLIGAKRLLFLPYWLVVLGGSLVLFLVGLSLLGGTTALLAGLGDRIRLFAGLNYFFVALNSFMAVSLVALVTLLSRPARIREGNGKDWAVFALLAMTAVLFGALLGNKSNIYVLMTAFLAVFHYCVRRFSLIEVGLLGGLFFLGLMIYQLFVREFLVVGEVVSLAEPRVEDFLKYSALQLSGNIMQLQTLSVLVDQVPENLDYQLGLTFLAFLTLPIPSTVWPDKLLTAPGVFTLAFWPERWLEEGTTLPPGLLGEFYLNFGWLGVLFGAVALAFVYESFFRRIRTQDQVRAEHLIYYVVLVGALLHFIRGEFSAPTLLVLSITAPVWLAGKLYKERR